MRVRIDNVRLAFPNLFTPTQVNGEGDPAYNAAFIFEPNSPAHKTLMKAAEQVGKEKWGDKWEAMKKTLQTKDCLLVHDGDTKPDLSGYPGNMYINARNKARPLVIDRDRSPLTAQDGRPYSGCYVNVSVDIWAQDNQFGKKINASLAGVQFLKDGEAFSGGAPAQLDDFEELADGADADDLA